MPERASAASPRVGRGKGQLLTRKVSPPAASPVRGRADNIIQLPAAHLCEVTDLLLSYEVQPDSSDSLLFSMAAKASVTMLSPSSVLPARSKACASKV